MTEEIGTVAGASGAPLKANGEMACTKLKKHLKAASPLFDWGISSLAREDKIEPDYREASRSGPAGWVAFA